MKKNFLIILFLFSSLVACSNNDEKVEPKYTIKEMNDLAIETRHSTEKNGGGINFSDYAAGADKLESKALMYERLTFYIVRFDTVELARSEALRLNQYYARNWLFDRVEGEPILEDYVIKTFKAINPRRRIQRVPKKAEEASESHQAAPASHH